MHENRFQSVQMIACQVSTVEVGGKLRNFIIESNYLYSISRCLRNYYVEDMFLLFSNLKYFPSLRGKKKLLHKKCIPFSEVGNHFLFFKNNAWYATSSFPLSTFQTVIEIRSSETVFIP